MVLYFTGTGNNKYVAQRIADALGDMLFCMNDCIRICDTSAVEAGERIVIVTPTYAWRIPRIVRDWLIKTELCGVKQTWFIMTCSSEMAIQASTTKHCVICKGNGFHRLRLMQRLQPMRQALSDEQHRPARRQTCLGQRLYTLHGLHLLLSHESHRVRQKNYRQAKVSF